MGLNEVCYCDIKKCPKLITNSLQSQGGGTSNQMGCLLFFFLGGGGCNKTVIVPGTNVSYLVFMPVNSLMQQEMLNLQNF